MEKVTAKDSKYAINLKGNSRYVYSNVTANFGNILSVSIYADKKTEYINVDLNTGKDIKFEEVFVSSAPINSLITEGVFKALAWDKLDSNYEKFGGILDMDKVDASNYEDIALMVVNNYKKIKQENDENAKPNIEKYLKYLAEEDKKNLISQIQDTTNLSKGILYD